MMFTYLVTLVPFLTAMGRATLAARPWLRLVSLP